MLPVLVDGAHSSQFVHLVEVRRDPPVHAARHAGGLALVDVDGDGRLELFVGRAEGVPDLLLASKADGTFEDQAAQRGLAVLDETLGAQFEDLDGDGRTDALLFGRGLHLLRGIEGGRFEPLRDAGLELPASFEGACTAVAIADVDGDGDRDLFVATSRVPPGDRVGARPFPLFDATNGPPRLFFRNEGAGRFRECAAEVGFAGSGRSLAFDARFDDVDDDGAPDLLIASECGRSQLFRNDGKGRFCEAPLLDHGELVGDARLLARGDLRGDGTTALLLVCASDPIGEASLSSKPAWLDRLSPRTRGDVLATARGGAWRLGEGGRFHDVAGELGLERLGPFTSGLVADLVGDRGAEVLLLGAATSAAGESSAPPPANSRDARFWSDVVPTFAQEGVDPDALAARFDELARTSSAGAPRGARLLARGADGRFVEVAVDLSALRGATRAIAWDFDGDGDLDLAAIGESEFDLLLLRNDRDAAAATSAAPHDRSAGSSKTSETFVVEPKVPAPALELATVDGHHLSLAAKRPRCTVLLVDRHEGAPIVEQVKSEGAKAVACDVVVLDAAASDAASREAVASFAVLVGHLVEGHADSAIVRVDQDGFVDLLAWDHGELSAAAVAGVPSRADRGGFFLDPPPLRVRELARDYLAASLPQQALSLLERSPSAGGAGVDFEAGLALSQLKRPRPAIERLQRVDAASAEYGLAQLELGRCQMRLGQRDAALKAFELAIAQRPADPAPYFERGRLLLAATDKETTDRATESLRTATYLRPDWGEAQVWFGQGLARVGRRGEAEQAFARAAALDPKDAQPHFELAKLKLAMNQRDEAIAEAQRALELAPGNPAATKLLDLIRAAPDRAPAPKDGAAGGAPKNDGAR